MNCPSCGSPNTDDAMYCGSCGTPMSAPVPEESVMPDQQLQAEYAVPATPMVAEEPPAAVPAPAQSGPDRIVAGYRAAALGDRLIAMILDAILLMSVFAAVGMAAGSRWGGLSPGRFDVTGTGALVTIGVNLVVGFIYYWLCEGLLGFTLGKAIAGVKIIDQNGAPCGLGPSLIRNILRIIDGQFGYLVGYFVAIFSKFRQRLGDHLAHTFAVEKEPRALYRALFIVLWVVLVAGGFVGAYFVQARS